MTTPVTYYGGKQMLADTIIGLMPAHKIYVEPFFGGGAVFWRKQKSYIEAINDTNHLLINFYRICQNNFDELDQLVSVTLHSEAMHHHAREIYRGKIDATDVQKAWAVWLLTNGSFGGKIGGGWRWDNGRSGSHSGISFCKKRNAFTHRLCDRLSEVQISCRDALACIANRDADTAFFYLDPPYPGSDQGHYRGYSFDDFTSLLDICECMRGKFILSNFQSDLLQEYVSRNGWNVIEKEMPLSVSNRAYANRKTELLIFNYKQPNKLL